MFATIMYKHGECYYCYILLMFVMSPLSGGVGPMA
jgi:hypothetical protein